MESIPRQRQDSEHQKQQRIDVGVDQEPERKQERKEHELKRPQASGLRFERSHERPKQQNGRSRDQEDKEADALLSREPRQALKDRRRGVESTDRAGVRGVVAPDVAIDLGQVVSLVYSRVHRPRGEEADGHCCHDE